MHAETGKLTDQNIILFDGICKLCHFSVRFVIRHDKDEKFRFAQLQSAIAKGFLEKAGLPPDYQNGLVYVQKDNVFLDSTAVLKILKELSGIWKLFYVFILIPRKIRDGLYQFIARTRYRIFGKYQKCPLPSKEWDHRFLK